MQRINFLVVIIILLFPLTIGAVPQLLNHQGYMLTNHGVPVVGSANVTFNLYADETGGDSVWTQTIPVTFDVGRYSVLLGPGEPELSIALFTGSDLYLGVTLEDQEEFVPRMPIASMPYAFRAEAVEGEVKAVGGLIVDGEVVINDQQQWVGSNISFNDLADIPEDLADGDDVGIEGSGTNGTIARFTESGLGDSVVVELDSKIGIGTDDPQATLQVAGSVQVEDDTDDCVETKEGTIRWHESKLEVCDGSDWAPVATAIYNGQSPSSAGLSCKTLLDTGGSQGNGVYWVDPDGPGGNDPYETYCNMADNDGGWTLAARMINNSWCHIDADMVSSLTAPDQSGCAKLSDADIRALYTDQFWLSCGTNAPHRFGTINAISNFNTTSSVGNKVMTWSASYGGSTYTGTDHSCCNFGDHNYRSPHIIYSIARGYNSGNYTANWGGCYNSNHGWYQNGYLYVR